LAFSRRLSLRDPPARYILNLFANRHSFPIPNTAKAMTSIWEELSTPSQRDQLERQARQRRWGLALLLVAWLHLLAFSLCYYLTVVCVYNEAPGYLAVWGGELCGVALIFHLCGRSGRAEKSPPLARFVVRVWIAYFVLAFNLCSMNTLRGHRMFELFPAMASLASFAFLVMTFTVNRRFFAAVLVMFAAGLLMAAFLLHAFLVFGVAWWLVLNGVGLSLLWSRRASTGATLAPKRYEKDEACLPRTATVERGEVRLFVAESHRQG